jgi:hypothetical protein
MTRNLLEALRRNGYTDRKVPRIPGHWPLEVAIPGDGPAQWWSPTDSPREHVYVANGRPFRVTFDRDMAPRTYAVLNVNGAGWVGRFPITTAA